jgi:hypothetical protein
MTQFVSIDNQWAFPDDYTEEDIRRAVFDKVRDDELFLVIEKEDDDDEA